MKLIWILGMYYGLILVDRLKRSSLFLEKEDLKMT